MACAYRTQRIMYHIMRHCSFRLCCDLYYTASICDSIVSQIWLTKLWDCAFACGVAMQSERKECIHLKTSYMRVWPKYFVIQILKPTFGVMKEHRKIWTQEKNKYANDEEKSRIYRIDNGSNFRIKCRVSNLAPYHFTCAVCANEAVTGMRRMRSERIMINMRATNSRWSTY